MSAYTVGSDHIDLIVTADMGLNFPSGNMPPALADSIGQDLLDENFRSVNHRYSESETAERYHWTPVAELLTDEVPVLNWIQVVNAISCLEYQSCEHEGWKTSTACLRLSALEEEVDRRIAAAGLKKIKRHGSMEWPNMDHMAWEWSRSDGFKTAEEIEAEVERQRKAYGY